MEGSNEAPHDIENPYIRILSSMSSELDGLLPLSNSCCIYRVPEELRRVNEKAYTPQVVSIGPLHHGSKGLKDMEEHKKRYLQYFLKRTGVSLEDCVKKIKDREAELRSCYAQTIELSSDEFVRIILVDAAFIIELLLRFCFPIQLESNDRIFNKPWLIKFIIPDMLLLENQLPFFILEDLFATGEVLATMPSVFVLSSIFCMVSTSLYVKIDDSGSFSSFQVEHFVDLIRTLHLPTEEENSQNQGPFETLPVPSMTKLHQAGVKFKARSSNNLFDICFEGRSLEIPNLLIQDDTELLLRNLVAFEQCHCDCTYFSDYIFLMDNLVNTPNDVELLVKNGIVKTLLGDNNEVSTLINSLGKGVTLDKASFYYATLTADLNNYYKKPWNKWKADLKQKHFNTPWTTISVIAAAMIIILTLIQTVCSFSQCAQR
ncbi:hypothetical protein D8674_014988 [Pyrus ussuriensis x Pyrus communis]|uniref:Uncharacterized protein n=1 Tax=Pyrus ussuriensis x Pyrus communis TaxID=2448454 RepID=A0A5N5GU30_9ROSA|nr:hypothetical protein D8674_014988 [Pyrus ussuriensis x Pyrus communis]